MDLKEYLKQQTRIIDGIPKRYYGAVEKQQRRLFGEISDLVDQLQTDDAGNILVNNTNYTITERIDTRLRQAFYNQDYVNAVDSFASGFDQSAQLNNKWLSGVLGGELGADITGTADLLIQRQKRNAIELLVSNSAIDSAFFTPIKNDLIQSVSTGESIKQLNRTLRTTILGAENIDGKLLRYTKQIANDSIATGDRNYMVEISENADIEFYRYSGGTISDTRKFCSTRNGGYYHKKEIQDWGNPNKSPENWQGRYRGTNSKTIFTWCGGYNCRHSLIPVSAVSVPKDWINRAIAKGYYKPNKAVQNELGVDSKTAKNTIDAAGGGNKFRKVTGKHVNLKSQTNTPEKALTTWKEYKPDYDEINATVKGYQIEDAAYLVNAKRQGYLKPVETLKETDIKNLIKSQPDKLIFRGWGYDSTTIQSGYLNQFNKGEHKYLPRGIYGNGYYFAGAGRNIESNVFLASQYTSNNMLSVAQLKPSAKIINLKELQKRQRAFYETQDKVRFDMPFSDVGKDDANSVEWFLESQTDYGAFATSLGYDAISTGGGAYVVLNPTALMQSNKLFNVDDILKLLK